MKQMEIKLHTFFSTQEWSQSLKAIKVIELLQYTFNFIVMCMFLNLPNVTHLSLMIIVFYIFKR